MSSQFSSVEDFLRKAREAKTSQRREVEEMLAGHFDDPHLISVPPKFGQTLQSLTENFGDEALRQIALFALGKWFSIHTTVVEDLVKQGETHAALSTTMDATRISQCISILECVGSFSGSDEWREMVRIFAVEAVADAYEGDTGDED
ncbi:MAG: hypothetical protein CMK37_07670 [Porticoccaceae bacterium]|nr:hypothetical protein [Porticoccaceae bacterium]